MSNLINDVIISIHQSTYQHTLKDMMVLFEWSLKKYMNMHYLSSYIIFNLFESLNKRFSSIKMSSLTF